MDWAALEIPGQPGFDCVDYSFSHFLRIFLVDEEEVAGASEMGEFTSINTMCVGNDHASWSLF